MRMRIFLLGLLCTVASTLLVVLFLFMARELGSAGPTCLPEARCERLEAPRIFFSWSESSMRASWYARDPIIAGTDGHLLIATLQKDIEAFLGPEVSLEYDVLPLFVSPVHLTITGSGMLLLGGITRGTATALERLHERFRAGQPAGRITSYALSPSFRESVVRDEQVSDVVSDQEGWRVRVTGSGMILGSATNGRMFAVSTSRHLLQMAMRESSAPPATYGGRLDRASVADALRRYGVPRSLFERAGWQATPMEWSLARNGYVMTFDITSSTLPHRVLP